MRKRVEVFLKDGIKSDEPACRDALCLIHLAYAKALCSGPLNKEYHTAERFGCDVAYSGSDAGISVFADEINKKQGMTAKIVEVENS